MIFWPRHQTTPVRRTETGMMTIASVGLILLAAGESRRMGSPKQLLPFRGRSLLRHAAETALASRCRPVIVVLGAHGDRLREEIGDLPLTAVENPCWVEGMGSSIRTGVAALEAISENVEAAVLMLCDQPLISPQILNDLIATYNKAKPLAVASEYGGTLGVPALFSRTLFPELKSLESATGAKQVLKRHLKDVFSLAVPAGALDVDTPEAYAALAGLTASTHGDRA